MPRGCRGQAVMELFHAASPYTRACARTRTHAHTHTITAPLVTTENFGHGPGTVFLLSIDNANCPKGLPLAFSHSPSHPETQLNT